MRACFAGVCALAMACGQAKVPAEAGASAGDANAGPVTKLLAKPDAIHGDSAVQVPDPVPCPVGTPPPDVEANLAPKIGNCVAQVPDDWPPNALPPDQIDASLARRDPLTGQVTAWHDGQWAPLVLGVQGTGHVDADILVNLPGVSDASVPVEVIRQVWFGCDEHYESPGYKIHLQPAGKPGWYAPAKPLKTIVNVPIPLACGRWVRLQSFFRIGDENHWHAAACTLRFYSAQPLDEP